MVVQRCKDGSVNADEIANLARIARGQALVIANELSREEERLSHWEYGKLFKSTKAAAASEDELSADPELRAPPVERSA